MSPAWRVSLPQAREIGSRDGYIGLTVFRERCQCDSDIKRPMNPIPPPSLVKVLTNQSFKH
jgi:hypothetical protein